MGSSTIRHGISYGGTTDPTAPEWATLRACEATRRQVEDYVGTIPASQLQTIQPTIVRHPMAETDVPIQLNRRARRAARALARRSPRRAA